MSEFTTQLDRLADGDERAVEVLSPILYEELKRIARSHLRTERVDHTLQPTALVHEAYVRLIGERRREWQGHSHFLSVAARAMRRVLVDYARRRTAKKRSPDAKPLTVSGAGILAGGASDPLDLLALDRALIELGADHPEPARVVELRYFGGLSIEEIASLMDVSDRTVRRYWRLAQVHLMRQIEGS